ncbi:MAG TPA: lysyl oxidase family protein [Candidatus Thermoplasmatota archaeon]|nr:lysyl oxidase family protein [Candidatus Thermoplasmatota archaeon]
MTRLRPTFVLLAAIALAAPLFAAPSAAEHPNTIRCVVPLVACPDLVVDATRFAPFKQTQTFSVNSCDVREGHTVPGTRTLLRFTFTTPNQGLADLVVGAPQGNPNFEFGECHGHYHFKEYADYRLWTPAQHAEYEALRVANPGVQAHVILAENPHLAPVKGDKRGFCVIDLIKYGPGPAKYLTCGFQGVSVGWADEYHWSLSGQYIDVTGVAPGDYILEAEVNSEHLYEESNYDNNRASRLVRI